MLSTCDSSAVVDCAGTCDSSAVVDCASTCDGSAVMDCAGTCDGPAVVDCASICDGSAGFHYLIFGNTIFLSVYISFMFEEKKFFISRNKSL